MKSGNKYMVLGGDDSEDPCHVITSQPLPSAPSTNAPSDAPKFARLISWRRYADGEESKDGFRGHMLRNRSIPNPVNGENTVSSNNKFIESHTATEFECEDAYENIKGRNPYGKHIYRGSFHGRFGYITDGEVVAEKEIEYNKGSKRIYQVSPLRVGYLTNGDAVAEYDYKKRVVPDRHGYTGIRTKIKRANASWGSPDDDIAQEIEGAGDDYEMMMDSDAELEYGDLEDGKELYMQVIEEDRKIFGYNYPH